MWEAFIIGLATGAIGTLIGIYFRKVYKKYKEFQLKRLMKNSVEVNEKGEVKNG